MSLPESTHLGVADGECILRSGMRIVKVPIAPVLLGCLGAAGNSATTRTGMRELARPRGRLDGG